MRTPADGHRAAERITRVLAFLLAGVLLVQWRLWLMLVSPTGGIVLAVVVGLLLALLVTAVVGLTQLRAWGFFAVYLLVPVATVLHGISLVPLVPLLLPLPWRFAAVILLNGAVFLAAVVAHTRYRQSIQTAPVT